jgi:hypothetical protein
MTSAPNNLNATCNMLLTWKLIPKTVGGYHGLGRPRFSELSSKY